MAVWHVRDFVAEDLEGVVRLDGESRTSEQSAGAQEVLDGGLCPGPGVEGALEDVRYGRT